MRPLLEILTFDELRRRAAAFFSTDDEKSECVGVMQHSSKGDCSGPALLKTLKGCCANPAFSPLPALLGCPTGVADEHTGVLLVNHTGVPPQRISFSGASITGDMAVVGSESEGEGEPAP